LNFNFYINFILKENIILEMEDKVLKELLKEKNRKSKSNRDKGRSHKERDHKHHDHKERDHKERDHKERDHKERDHKERDHKERDHKSSSHKSKNRHHRSKSEGSSVRQIVAQSSPEPVDKREKFMFIYEDEEGKLYTTVDKIGLIENQSIKIFPVYFVGSNENLSEETVKYVDSKLTSETENSWLEIINSTDENMVIFDFDLDDIVVYNGKFFYSDGALIEYLKNFDAEYLPIFKID